jgi:hypothetical protein
LPNGFDKNLMRVYEVVNGFCEEYGRFPTVVRMPRISCEDLLQNVLTPAGARLLQDKIRIEISEDLFCAEDSTGVRYEYLSRDDVVLSGEAERWLGLEQYLRSDEGW